MPSVCTYDRLEWYISFGFIYFRRVFIVSSVIPSICLLFTIIKITVLSHISYLYRFKTVDLPWIDHNALRYAQNSRWRFKFFWKSNEKTIDTITASKTTGGLLERRAGYHGRGNGEFTIIRKYISLYLLLLPFRCFWMSFLGVACRIAIYLWNI